VAKSQNRQVDKVERKARLDVIHRQREVEQRELRNLNRMGWMEMDDDVQDDEEEPKWGNGRNAQGAY
jgi:hypothetical protein